MKLLESIQEKVKQTKARIHTVLDITPNPWLSFSGGKDSGLLLELALECAKERDETLIVDFFDQEIIPFQTVEYVQRQVGRDYLNLRYWAVPLRENNAGSEDSWWWPWDPAYKEHWIRPRPDHAITEHPCLLLNKKGVSEDDIIAFYSTMQRRAGGSITMLGQRAEESPSRRGYVHNIKKSGDWSEESPDAFIISSSVFKGCRRAYPMSEWTLQEVWGAIHHFRYDWNRAYVVMHNSGVPPHRARIGPLFGEEPMNNIWSVMRCFPEVWTKIPKRVKGPETISRYSHTEVFGRGRDTKIPSNVEGIALVKKYITKIPEAKRAMAVKSIKDIIDFAIRTGTADRIDWKVIMRSCLLGDTKAGRARSSSQLNRILLVSDSGRFVPGTRDALRVKTIKRMKRAEKERQQHERVQRAKESAPDLFR